jgi:hypothetical protein
VVDQPAPIGALPVAVARTTGDQVAYLPGLAMRRIADLYLWRAETDAWNAFVIGDAARSLRHALRPVEVGDDALAELDAKPADASLTRSPPPTRPTWVTNSPRRSGRRWASRP